MNRGTLAKQLQSLLRNINTFTDGQVQLVECDWDNMSYVKLEIAPNDGIYKGGRFLFLIDIPYGYPECNPDVTSLTPIFHPNIENDNSSGNVCLSLFNDWTPRNTLEDVVMGLLFLLYNPNIEDPLSSIISSDMATEEFERIQGKILKKQTSEAFDELDIKLEDYYQAQSRNDELLDVEWDVLGEAAKAEWSNQLAQDKWQEEIAEAAKKENEMFYKRNERTFLNSIQSNEHNSRDVDLRTDHAFGKLSLQRFTTVTAPEQQANLLKFNAPNKETVSAWNTSLQEKNDQRQEEAMDCDEVCKIKWNPLCTTDVFNRPKLQKTITC